MGIESAASPVPLEPGDILSWVSGGSSPLGGHVATVVSYKACSIPAEPNVLGVIEFVSGNAKGAAPLDGAVRVELAWRERLPADFPVRHEKQARIYNEYRDAARKLADNDKKQTECEHRDKEKGEESEEHRKLEERRLLCTRNRTNSGRSVLSLCSY